MTADLTPPPWGELVDVLAEHRYRDAGLDPARRAHLDRVQASLREGAALHGFDITDPDRVFTSLALLDHLRTATLVDHEAGSFTDVEAAAILATLAIFGSVLTRWAPDPKGLA